MTIGEANDINLVLHWAMGHRVAWPGGRQITDEDASAAGKRLAGRALKTLLAGLRPDQVTLTREVPETCRVCGCTTERPCQGGCRWVADPKMIGELCDRCAVLLEQVHLI